MDVDESSDQNLDLYFSPAGLVPMSCLIGICNKYSKTCLKRPLKIDKAKVLMENGSLMKVESIAECSPWSILQYL